MKNYTYKATSNPDLERVVDLNGDWQNYFKKSTQEYLRGVTSILKRGYAKGNGFYEALKKSTPEEWEKRLAAGGDRGDALHQIQRMLLSGEKCDIHTKVLAENNKDYRELTIDEWESVLAFQDFWKQHGAKIVAVEESVDRGTYAGTLDWIVILTKKCENHHCKCEKFLNALILGDLKTGTGIFPDYGAQVAALARAHISHLTDNRAVLFTMVLHLNRKTDIGWKTEFYDMEETETHYREFLSAMTIDDATYKPFDPDKEIYDIPETLDMVVEKESEPKPKKERKPRTKKSRTPKSRAKKVAKNKSTK
jgi:hypothetical protein